MDYDEYVHSKDIQILKSMLPFIDRQQQMPLAIMIQIIEFKNAINLFKDKAQELSENTIHNDKERQMAMMSALLKNVSKEEQETVNNMMNMINMMQMMSDEDMMENLGNMI
jgi:hypothetical protein